MLQRQKKGSIRVPAAIFLKFHIDALYHTQQWVYCNTKSVFSCKLTVVKHTSVGQQQRDQFGVLVQLHGVLALVGKQSANVNSEIHFVG